MKCRFMYRGKNLSILFVAVTLIAVLSCANKTTSETDAEPAKITTSSAESSSRLKVDITVNGLEPGTGYFGSIFGDKYFTIAEVDVLAGGKLTIEDSKKHGGYYYFLFPDKTTSIPFLLDEDQEFSLETDIGALVSAMKVTGSLDNELFYQNQKFEENYQKEIRPISNQLRSLDKNSSEYKKLDEERNKLVETRDKHIADFKKNYPNSFFTKFKIAGQNPKLTYPKKADGSFDNEKQINIYRKAYWDNYDFSDLRLFRTPVYSNKLKNFIEKTIPQKADSLIKWGDWVTRQSMANDTLFQHTANFIGIKYKKPTFMGGDAVYAHMVKNFFTHDLAFWSDENEIRALQQDATIRGRSLPGVIGRNIEGETPEGNAKSLYDIDARFIVLYFYSVSCENCQKESPQLVKIYNEWKNRGVDVMAFCIDDDIEGWKNYIKKNNMAWHNVIDPDYSSNYNLLYHIDVTPEMYVLKNDFTVIAKDVKSFQLPQVFASNNY